MLRDGAYAELQVAGIDRLVELAELQLQVVKVGLPHRVRPPQVGIVHGERAEPGRVETHLAFLPRREADRLLDLDVALAGPGDRRAKGATDLLRRCVAQAAVDRQLRGIGSWQRKFGVDRGLADHHRAGDPEVDGLPDSGITVRHKGIAVVGILPRSLVSDPVPVDPVVPAVGEFHSVDVLDRLLRGDLDRQGVGAAWIDPSRDVELVGVVHPDDAACCPR